MSKTKTPNLFYLQRLSPREREVLEMIAKTGGASNKVLAKRLGISYRTVDVHTMRIGKALGVSGKIQIVLFYERLKREEEELQQRKSAARDGRVCPHCGGTLVAEHGPVAFGVPLPRVPNVASDKRAHL